MADPTPPTPPADNGFADLLKKCNLDPATPAAEIPKALAKYIDEMTTQLAEAKKNAGTVGKPAEIPQVAASLVAPVAKIQSDARRSQLKAITGTKLTPAAAADLETRYCNIDTLTLSMQSGKAVDDGFDALLATLAKNENIRSGSSESTQGQILVLSNAQQQDANANPLLKVCTERATAAAK